MDRFASVAAEMVGIVALCAAGSSLARDVTVPRRQAPGTAERRSSIFESIETTVAPTEATACPERFVFLATIKTKVPPTTPVVVTYRWDRSDHAIGPVTTESWMGPGPHYASTYWMIGSSTGGTVSVDLWERLHMLSPEDAVSNLAAIRVRCRARDGAGREPRRLLENERD